ncbi:sugar/nucleoside kinase (ribokinase family) [Paenibacillus taihuensis]|uniref:Sugar/nucleoside kinase (Ribokinase family) n=1 Tax=Paenibacillus taihuensis TaxID=1156355 RepID=A0A3D9RR60_9BACL|nr:carbohydrate kinase family protein [Paenibacillus taihuensis]REE77693.1 sugar/nucleoside kinase (ribokinase family) [Paenibacillus taihuensis]
MASHNEGIVVAGHICLDIIPELKATSGALHELLVPGKLVDTGPVMLSTGGAVSNTGLALHRLGFSVRLMGKIGDDLFGRAIQDILRSYSPELAETMIVAEGESSSYTIVINPLNVDRVFLHCTGANDTFKAADVVEDTVKHAGMFHFGYPPLMREMYLEGGKELTDVLRKAKSSGATVSLDMAKPDPASDAGAADWGTILSRALPHVDLFLPSFDEIVYMLRRDVYDHLSAEAGEGELIPFATLELLASLTDELISMGAAVVAIKLGEHGLYAKTTADASRFREIAGRMPESWQSEWLGQEYYATCFNVEVAGTTGAGDCTIAGFLAGWHSGLSMADTMRSAVGAGACNVEKLDAVTGIPTWQQLRNRIDSGWASRKMTLALEGLEPVSHGLYSN